MKDCPQCHHAKEDCRCSNGVPFVVQEADRMECGMLLGALIENKETVITGVPEDQGEAEEPRYSLTISGPARLVQQLAEYL